LNEIYKAQKASLEMNQKYMEEQYNKKAKPTVYAENMLVWMHNDIRKIGECSKFRNEFLKTPFKIIKVVGTHNLKLQNTVTGKILKNLVHVDRVKHMIPRDSVSEDLESEKAKSASPNGQSETLESPDEKETEKSTVNDSVQNSEMQEKNGVRNPNEHADNVYEVEKLLRMKGVGPYRMYLVRWKKINGQQDNDSWVRVDDISPVLVQKFHEKFTMTGKLQAQYRRK
jgi:hypothetical protein